jgi:hypothetical protein
MAADAARSRLLVVGLVLAIGGVAATGLMVAFRNDTAAIEGRDSARGERLKATLVLEVEDEAVADATATLTLTNTTDETAWFAPAECSVPSEPWIAPEGARAPGAVETHAPLRERLITAGATARSVTLYPDDDECEPPDGPVELAAHETLTVAYVAEDHLDRSSPLRAVAAITEVTRSGRSISRLRLVIPIENDPDAHGATIDQAVDAFLADPQVADFVAASGNSGMLTTVTLEEDGWRIGLSSSIGDLSAEVLDGIAVTSVTVSG